MNTIDVDFDVYKKLTALRQTEAVSYNDVIRELLGLGIAKVPEGYSTQGSPAEDWVAKGVRFPAGTEFQAHYQGQSHTGRVEGGALAVNGKKFRSPSAAAVAITGSSVNGWRFWECRLAGEGAWQSIERLRRR